MSKPSSSQRETLPAEPAGSSMSRAQLAGRRARILREIEQALRDQPRARGRLRRLCDEFAAIEFAAVAVALSG